MGLLRRLAQDHVRRAIEERDVRQVCFLGPLAFSTPSARQLHLPRPLSDLRSTALELEKWFLRPNGGGAAVCAVATQDGAEADVLQALLDQLDLTKARPQGCSLVLSSAAPNMRLAFEALTRRGWIVHKVDYRLLYPDDVRAAEAFECFSSQEVFEEADVFRSFD
jgi:hypothetical protein